MKVLDASLLKLALAAKIELVLVLGGQEAHGTLAVRLALLKYGSKGLGEGLWHAGGAVAAEGGVGDLQGEVARAEVGAQQVVHVDLVQRVLLREARQDLVLLRAGCLLHERGQSSGPAPRSPAASCTPTQAAIIITDAAYRRPQARPQREGGGRRTGSGSSVASVASSPPRPRRSMRRSSVRWYRVSCSGPSRCHCCSKLMSGEPTLFLKYIKVEIGSHAGIARRGVIFSKIQGQDLTF